MSAGSMSAGSSIASSGMSGSEMTSRTVMLIFTEQYPLFPFFHTLSANWDPKFNIVGIVIQLLQLIALIINTNEDWGNVLHHVRKGLYFITLPIWDKSFNNQNLYVPCMIIFWTCWCVLAATAVVHSIIYKDKGHNQVSSLVSKVARVIPHFVASVGFIPFVNMMLAFSLCSEGKIRPFDKDCWGPWHAVHLVAAILAILLVVGYSFVSNLLIYRSFPCDPSLSTSRPNSRTDEYYLLYRSAVVVFFQICHVKEEPKAFAGILCILSFCMFLCTAMWLPYYSERVNRLVAAKFAMVTWIAFVGLLRHVEPNVKDYTALLVLGGGLISAFIGYRGFGLRISWEYSTVLTMLRAGDVEALENKCENPPVPAYLPTEVSKSSFDDIDDVLQQETNEGPEGTKPSGLIYPYISQILFPTDIEVCCRYLRDYVLSTGTACTGPMLIYAVKIFAKGSAKFPQDGTLKQHFALFLAYYAGCAAVKGVPPLINRMRASLAEAELVMGFEISLAVLYQAFQLQLIIKPLIGLTNDTHRKIVTNALRTYKDILNQMSLFWNKLLTENVDTLHLAVVANAVTTRREIGLGLFKKALTHPTTSLVKKYIQFLRQVMIDDDSADQLEQRLAYINSERQQATGANKGGEAMNVALLNEFGDMASELRTGGLTAQKMTLQHETSSTIKKLNTNMHVMFFSMIIVLASFFAFEAYLAATRRNYVDQVSAAGFVRASAMQSAVLVQDIDSQVDPDLLEEQKVNLKQLAEQFMTEHNRLAHGDLQNTYSSLNHLYKSYSCEHIEIQADGNKKRALTPLWSFGNQYGNALLTIAASSQAFPAQKSDSDYITANAAETLAPALDRILGYLEDAHAANMEFAGVIVAAMFCVSLLLVFFVYLTMIFSFKDIGTSKLATLNLFTFIPHVHLVKLAEEARTRLETCDQEEGDDNLEQAFGEKAKVEKQDNEEKVSSHHHVVQLAEELLRDEIENQNKDSPRDDEEASEDGRRESQPQQKKKSRSNNIYHAIVATLLVVVALSCNVLLVLAWNKTTVSNKDFDDIIYQQELASRYYYLISEISRKAQLYAQYGEKRYEVQFWRITKRGEVLRVHQKLLRHHKDAQRFLDAAEALEEITKAHLVSQAFIQKIVLKNESKSKVKDVRWTDSFNKNSVDGRQLRPPVYPVSDPESDLAKSESELWDLGRSAIFSEKYFFSLHKALDSLHVDLVGTGQSLNYDSSIEVIALAFVVIQVFCILYALYTIDKTDAIRKVRSIHAVLALHLLFAISVISLLATILVMSEDAREMSRDAIELLELKNKTEQLILGSGNSALAYSQFGELHYIDTEDSTTTLDTYIDRVLSLSDDFSFRDYSTGYSSLHALKTNERVAIQRVAYSKHVLNYTYQNDSLKFPLIPGSRNWIEYEYDSKALGDLYTTQVLPYQRSDKKILLYTTSRTDEVKSDEMQMKIARFAVSCLGFTALRDSTRNSFITGIQQAIDKKQKKLSDTQNTILSLIVLAAIAEGASVGVLAVYGVSMVSALLLMLSGKSSRSEYFPELMRQCRISLLFVGALLCVAYVLTFVEDTATNSVKDSDQVSKREWLLSNSMFLCQKLFSENLPSEEVITVQGNLEAAIDELGLNRRDISKISGRSSELDKITFGDPQADDTTFLSTSGVVSGRKVGVCADVPAFSVLDKGLELGVFKWISMLIEISQMDPLSPDFQNPDGRAKYLQRKLLSLDQGRLFKTSIEASSIFSKTMKDVIDKSSTVFFLWLVVIAVIVLIGYIVIFKPMVRLLGTEEDGTKLMLTMIPQEVRETVPAIAEYLSTGVITLDEKYEIVNEHIVEYSAVSTVVIDTLGTVLRFSRAAVELFGYEVDEVVGKNIKILMPEQFASHHDEYLSSYKKTGVKKVIDTIRIAAGLRKDGTEFKASLQIKELVKSGRETVYIGNVTDYSTELEKRRQEQIRENIIKMSLNPLIIINTSGVIQHASDTCKNAFASDKCVGVKINNFMPDHIAMKHDQYLQNYLRTKEAHIIGMETEILMIDANGRQFMSVVEIGALTNIKGECNEFVGYFRDLTEEKHFEFQATVADAAVDLATQAVICIDDNCNILRFSRVAENLLDYTSAEVLGKNVNILMPPDTASAHDSNVQRYQKTGEKRIIDTKRMVDCISKSGEHILVELMVHEIEGRFTGYMRPANMDAATDMQAKLQKAMLAECRSAVVAINHRGMITEFNKAAVSLWGYSKEEALKNNVTILMEEHVGSVHQTYLERYRSTKEAKILGSFINLTIKKKNSLTQSCQALLLEVVITEKESVYVAIFNDVSEKVKIETLNRMNNTITRMLTSPLFTINHLGVINFANPAVSELGYEVDELINKNISRLMPDDIAKRHNDILANYMQTRVKKVIGKTSMQLVKFKSGTLVPRELVIREISVEGAQLMFTGLLRDASLERLHEEKQVKYNVLVGCVPLAFFRISRRGIIAEVNKKSSELFGHTNSEFIGKNIKMVMPQEIARKHDTFLRTYQAKRRKVVIGKSEGVPNTGCSKDGRLFPVVIYVREVIAGSSCSYVGFISDETEKFSAELNLKIKDHILEENPTPIVTTDLYGTISSYSKAAENATGWNRDDIIGKNVKILQEERIARIHDSRLKAYRKTGKKKVIDQLIEVCVRRKNKTLFKATLSVKHVSSDTDSFLVGCFRDNADVARALELEKESTAMLSMAPNPLIIMSDYGIVESFNPAAEAFFGYRKNEIVNNNIKILQHPVVADVHDEKLAQYRKTKKTTVLGVFVEGLNARHKDGHNLVFDILSTAFSVGEENEVFFAQIQDASTKAESRDRQQVNEVISNLMMHPIITIDQSCIILKANRMCAELFGYSQQEVIGKNVNMFMPSKTAMFHDGYMARYLATRKKHVIGDSFRGIAKSKSGREMEVRLNVNEIQTRAGSIFVGNVKDIKLELDSERLIKMAESIMQISGRGIITIKPDGIIVNTNKAVRDLLGYTEEDLVGNNVKMIMPKEIAEQHDYLLERYRTTGVSHLDPSGRAVFAKRKDGRLVHSLIIVRAVSSGNRTQYVGYLVDQTYLEERRETNEIDKVLAEYTTVPIIVADTKGVITKFSEEASKCWKLNTTDVVSQNLKILMPPEVAAKHDSYLERYLKTGKKNVLKGNLFEATAKRGNGELFTVQLKACEVSTNTEWVQPSYIAFARDTSVAIENELSVVQNKLVIEESETAIIGMSEYGIIHTFNKAAADLLGYSIEEILGTNIKIIVSEEHRDNHDFYLENYRKTGVKKVVDARTRVKAAPKTGPEIEVMTTVREIRLPGVPPQFISYVSADDSTQYENAQLVNNATFSLLESAVVVISSDGTIRKWTTEACQLFGYAETDIVGSNVSALMPEDVAKIHQSRIDQYIETRHKTMVDSTTSVVARAKTGFEFPVLVSVRELPAESEVFFAALIFSAES